MAEVQSLADQAASQEEIMAIAELWTSVLSKSIIDRRGQRAAGYGRENRFFAEDFEELRQAGYLLLAVPKELGGRGLSLADVCQEQRRLTYRAPATALATNMHLDWTLPFRTRASCKVAIH